MDNSIRVMVELGRKKRVVASALDWPGWDRSGMSEEDALRVLVTYRPRYARVAALVGLADEFDATRELAAHGLFRSGHTEASHHNILWSWRRLAGEEGFEPSIS